MHRAVREPQPPVLLLLLEASLLLGTLWVQHAIQHCREEVLDEHLGTGLQSAFLQNGSQPTLNPDMAAQRIGTKLTARPPEACWYMSKRYAGRVQINLWADVLGKSCFGWCFCVQACSTSLVASGYCGVPLLARQQL